MGHYDTNYEIDAEHARVRQLARLDKEFKEKIERIHQHKFFDAEEKMILELIARAQRAGLINGT